MARDRLATVQGEVRSLVGKCLVHADEDGSCGLVYRLGYGSPAVVAQDHTLSDSVGSKGGVGPDPDREVFTFLEVGEQPAGLEAGLKVWLVEQPAEVDVYIACFEDYARQVLYGGGSPSIKSGGYKKSHGWLR